MGDDAGAPGKFAIDGALTIRTADAALQRLRALLEQHGAVAIDTSRVTELDVSGIQLILASRATARKSGKAFSVAQPLSAAAHAALLQGGFLGAGDAGKPSFWLGGEV
jgi:anti-sigma B factor antagonist